jgi:hypothetical protein
MSVDEESADKRRQLAHTQYAPALRKFEISAAADGALRRLVEFGRRNGSKVAFYLMPEGELFRSWYPADVRAKLTAYLARLTREEQVLFFDATEWCREDDFADSHHLRHVAATGFSQRFGREIATPFVTWHIADEAAPWIEGRQSEHKPKRF